MKNNLLDCSLALGIRGVKEKLCLKANEQFLTVLEN